MNRKEEIIIATLELAAEKGLGTVSMAHIADRIGIKKASIYNHFKSKEEIIGQMYTYLRRQAKQQKKQGNLTIDELLIGRTMREILHAVIDSYKELNADPQMVVFYKVITAERCFNLEAAKIMVEETKTMIQSTKLLFYAMQVKKIAQFDNPDTAAVTFAMAVHSIMDHEADLEYLGQSDCGRMMDDFIEEFCTRYGAKERFGDCDPETSGSDIGGRRV